MNFRTYGVIFCAAMVLSCSGIGPEEEQGATSEPQGVAQTLVFDPARDPLEVRAIPRSLTRFRDMMSREMAAFGAKKPLEDPRGIKLQDRWSVVAADAAVANLGSQSVTFNLRAQALTKHRTLRVVRSEEFASGTADAPCTDCTVEERNRRLREACDSHKPNDPQYFVSFSIVSIENRGVVSGHNWWRAGCRYHRTTPPRCSGEGTRHLLCPFNSHDGERTVELATRCSMGQESLKWACQHSVDVDDRFGPVLSEIEAVLDQETRYARNSPAYPDDMLECAVNTPEFRQYCKLRDGGNLHAQLNLPKEVERFGRKFAIGEHWLKGSLQDDARMDILLAWSTDSECWRSGAAGSLVATTNSGSKRITVRDAGRLSSIPVHPITFPAKLSPDGFVLLEGRLALSDEDAKQSFEARLPAQCTLRPIDVRLSFDVEALTRRLYYLAGKAQDKRDLMATSLVLHGFLTAREHGAVCAVHRVATALQGSGGRSFNDFPSSWQDTVGNAVVEAARAGALPEGAAASPVADSTDGWRFFREHSAVFDRSACMELPPRADAPEALDAAASNEARRNAAMYLGAKNELIALLTEGWAITQAARIPVPPASRELHLEWLVAGVPDGESI